MLPEIDTRTNKNDFRNQGTIGLSVAIFYFCRRGYEIYQPLNDTNSFIDFVAYHRNTDTFSKVQSKTSNRRTKQGYYQLKIGQERKSYWDIVKSKIDYLTIFTGEDRLYVVPNSHFSCLSNSITFSPAWDRFRVAWKGTVLENFVD